MSLWFPGGDWQDQNYTSRRTQGTQTALGNYSNATSTLIQIINNQSNAVTTQIIFGSWARDLQTTSTASVWSAWSDEDQNIVPVSEYARGAPLAEADIETQREAKVRRDAYYAEIELAKQRAEELLLKHLTPAQRADYLRSKWFIVEGGKGERFKVHADRGVHGNIVRLEGEREIETLCFRIKDELQCPHHDHLLTQKMMLEHHYEDVLKIAGRVRRAA